VPEGKVDTWKISSPLEHCGNTHAGRLSQVIAEETTDDNRLSFGNEVAIKSKPRALTRHLAICVGSAPGALALMDLLLILRSTSHEVPHFSDRLLIDAFIILRNLGLTPIQWKPSVWSEAKSQSRRQDRVEAGTKRWPEV
jgi:hypothetical protein